MIDLDKNALERAMKIIAAGSKDRADQISSMLADRPWAEVAHFASYCVQGDALSLAPWETPPCDADITSSDPAAMQLLQRLLDAGLSKYEPDPVAALDLAEERDTRAR
jgi:hypothetical protein